MNPRQPYPPAVDYDGYATQEQAPHSGGYYQTPVSLEPEPIPLSPFQRDVLNSLHWLASEVKGLTGAIGELAPRVAKLEQDARWKAIAVKVGKAAVPFVGGAVVAKFPQLASALAPLLQAIGGAP